MRRSFRLTMARSVGVAILALWSTAGVAQAVRALDAYPQKSVRVLVGSSPGGSPDTLARILATKLGELLNQQFVVENRPGANGVVAADLVVKSAPDGYTLFVGESGLVALHPHLNRVLPFDGFRDLMPIAAAVAVPLWLVTHPSVPASSVAELLSHARVQANPLPYASSGTGSIHHIAMEAFKAQARVDFLHVPFKGTGQSIPALISGDVLLGFVGYASLGSVLRAGRLRVLALSTARRSDLTPDIPSIAEAGLHGFDFSGTLGVFAPAGTRREIVTRLSDAISMAVRAPELADRLANLGMEPLGSTAEQYDRSLRNEHERYGKLVRQLGLRVD